MSDPILSAVLGLILFLLVGQISILGAIYYRMGQGAAWIETLKVQVEEIFDRLRHVETDLAEVVGRLKGD